MIENNDKNIFDAVVKKNADKFDFDIIDNEGNNLLHFAANPMNFGSYKNTDILSFIY